MRPRVWACLRSCMCEVGSVNSPSSSVGVAGAVISAARLIVVLFVWLGRMSRTVCRRLAVTICFLHTFNAYYYTKVIKNIQVLCFWARERERASQPLLAADFTAAALAEAKETMRLRDETQQEALSIKPDKFDPNQWTEWSKHFTTYLSHTKGVQYAPLDYVIRTETPPTAPANMNQRERALYQFPLNG